MARALLCWPELQALRHPDGSSFRGFSSMHHCTLKPGAVLDGKYKLVRPIASGAMAIVYEAHDNHLDRTVAIKLVHTDCESTTEVAQRTILEAKTMARLSSPYITQVLDIGSTPDGFPYVVMEYLKGRRLADLIAEGRLSPELAVELATQLCDALRCIHSQDVTHRDLKPENLVLTRSPGSDSPVLKLLDFGIAKDPVARRSFVQPNLTQSRIVGSVHYMAPEQICAPEQVDQRADLWAVGVILYQMLSGSLPFEGGSVAETCARILAGQYLSLEERGVRVATRLVHIVDTCVALDPTERFADARTLQKQLLDLTLSTKKAAERIVESRENEASKNGESSGTDSDHTPFPLIPSSSDKEAWAATTMPPVVRRSRGPRRALLVLALLTALPWASPERVHACAEWCSAQLRALPTLVAGPGVTLPPQPDLPPPGPRLAPCAANVVGSDQC